MSLRSCPLCHLIFGSANELVWHVHNEHHCLTEEEGLKVEVSQAASTQLDATTLADLLLDVDEAAVSLLLPTTPAVRMTSVDSAWLEYLSKCAHSRMARELHPTVLATMARRWEAALSLARGAPRDKGIAVYVSTRQMAVFWLPFPPRARVAFGASFAVRDLAYALQRFPRYRVLVLGGRRPRILEGWANHLAEAPSPSEPLAQATLQGADAALADRVITSGELPLVVAGPPRSLAQWSERSRHSSLLIGTVHTQKPDAPKQAIGEMAEPVVSAWREAVAAVEVATLAHADRGGLVKWGLEPAWLALSQGRAEHLWLRCDFAAPAVRHGTGWELQDAAGPHVRGQTDDVVEELLRGARDVEAQVHFIEAGVLPYIEPVGAQVAPARRQPRAQAHGHRDLRVVDVTAGVLTV